MKKKRFLTLLFMLFVVVVAFETKAQVDAIQTAKVTEEQDYAFAYGLYKDGLFQFAHEQFQRFLEKYPSSIKRPDAMFLSVESLFQQEHFEIANLGYKNFTHEYPHSRLTDDAYFRLGESYLKLRNAQDAINAFKIVLDRFSTSELAGESTYWIGEAYIRQEDFDNALKYYQLAYENYPNNKLRDYSLYSIGWTLQRKKEYGKAVEWYRKLTTEFPDGVLSSASLVRIGECYYYVKDYRKAIDELTKAQGIIKTEEEKGEAEYLVGESYYHLDDFERARTHYEKFLETFLSHSLKREVIYALGWTHLKQNKFQKAIEVFDQVIEGYDQVAQGALFRKGIAQKLSGQSEAALKTWNEVSDRWPRGEYSDNAIYQSGIALYEGNRTKESQRAFERIVNEFPKSDVLPDAYRMLGECFIIEGRFEQARDVFEKAINHREASFDARLSASFQYSWSLFKLKKYSEASKAFSQFVNTYEKHPKALEARYWLAESEYLRGNFAAAAREYQIVAAVPQAAKREEALYGAGWSLYKQNEFHKSIEFFEKLVATYPNGKFGFDARLRIGDSYFFLKDYAKASGSYRAAIRIFPENESLDYAYYQLAQTYYRMNDHTSAVQQFSALMKNFPKSQLADDAQYAIGWIWFQAKQYSEAILEFQKLIRSYPNSELIPRAYYSIGDAYYNQQKYTAAEKSYREMINRYPESAYVLDAVSGIQYCMVAQGKLDEVPDVIDSFIRQHPSLASSEPLLLKKADLFFSQRQYDRAAREYRAFAEKFSKSPNAAAAYYWAGKSFRALGQHADATANFERAPLVANAAPKIAVQSILEASEIYIEKKQFDRALMLLSDIEKEYSGVEGASDALFLKGSVFLQNGDQMEARNQFSYLLSKYPGTVGSDKARLALARISHAAGDQKSALQYAEQVSTTRTDDLGAEAQYLIGSMYAEHKEWQSAITAFLRMRYVFPRYDYWHAKALLGLGNAYENTQDLRKAREVYQLVLKFDKEREAVLEAERRLKNLNRP